MAEERADAGSQEPAGDGERKQVVFAPRIDAGLREQVEGIRTITGQTINEVGQEALQAWVEGKLADEDVRQQAMAGIEEEERKLQARRAAINSVLGEVASEGGGSAGRRRNG